MKKRDWAKINYDGEKLVLSLDDGNKTDLLSSLTYEQRESLKSINRWLNKIRTTSEKSAWSDLR